MNYRKYLIVSTFLSGALLGGSAPLFSAPNPTNCRTLCTPAACKGTPGRVVQCQDWCAGIPAMAGILQACVAAAAPATIAPAAPVPTQSVPPAVEPVPVQPTAPTGAAPVSVQPTASSTGSSELRRDPLAENPQVIHVPQTSQATPSVPTTAPIPSLPAPYAIAQQPVAPAETQPTDRTASIALTFQRAITSTKEKEIQELKQQLEAEKARKRAETNSTLSPQDQGFIEEIRKNPPQTAKDLSSIKGKIELQRPSAAAIEIIYRDFIENNPQLFNADLPSVFQELKDAPAKEAAQAVYSQILTEGKTLADAEVQAITAQLNGVDYHRFTKLTPAHLMLLIAQQNKLNRVGPATLDVATQYVKQLTLEQKKAFLGIVSPALDVITNPSTPLQRFISAVYNGLKTDAKPVKIPPYHQKQAMETNAALFKLLGFISLDLVENLSKEDELEEIRRPRQSAPHHSPEKQQQQQQQQQQPPAAPVKPPKPGTSAPSSTIPAAPTQSNIPVPPPQDNPIASAAVKERVMKEAGKGATTVDPAIVANQGNMMAEIEKIKPVRALGYTMKDAKKIIVQIAPGATAETAALAWLQQRGGYTPAQAQQIHAHIGANPGTTIQQAAQTLRLPAPQQ